MPYLAYVRPFVEFNSIVWSPDTVKDIVALEGVQRRFTKKEAPGSLQILLPRQTAQSAITEFRTEASVCRFSVVL